MNTSFRDKLAGFLSGCCLIAAAILLLHVCSYCYPDIDHYGKKLLFGMEHGAAREAFSVLAESLEEGDSIKESVVRSYEVLIGTED